MMEANKRINSPESSLLEWNNYETLLPPPWGHKQALVPNCTQELAGSFTHHFLADSPSIFHFLNSYLPTIAPEITSKMNWASNPCLWFSFHCYVSNQNKIYRIKKKVTGSITGDTTTKFMVRKTWKEYNLNCNIQELVYIQRSYVFENTYLKELWWADTQIYNHPYFKKTIF